jgi:hypothetical protein
MLEADSFVAQELKAYTCCTAAATAAAAVAAAAPAGAAKQTLKYNNDVHASRSTPMTTENGTTICS